MIGPEQGSAVGVMQSRDDADDDDGAKKIQSLNFPEANSTAIGRGFSRPTSLFVVSFIQQLNLAQSIALTAPDGR